MMVRMSRTNLVVRYRWKENAMPEEKGCPVEAAVPAEAEGAVNEVVAAAAAAVTEEDIAGEDWDDRAWTRKNMRKVVAAAPEVMVVVGEENLVVEENLVQMFASIASVAGKKGWTSKPG
jgi:hypothetical protein